MKKERSWATLFEEYANARTEAQIHTKIQEAVKVEIKERLEKQDLDEVDSVDFTCLYRYEKDKEVFDEELFEKKDPKKYAQYLEMQEEIKTLTKKYTKKAKGARKLIVTRKNEGEE